MTQDDAGSIRERFNQVSVEIRVGIITLILSGLIIVSPWYRLPTGQEGPAIVGAAAISIILSTLVVLYLDPTSQT